MSTAEPWFRRAWLWWVLGGVLGALVIVVVLAPITRPRVADQLEESTRLRMDAGHRAAVDQGLGGTGCGDWPLVAGPSVAPPAAEGASVVWADAQRFHIITKDPTVRAARIEVADGRVAIPDGEPAPTLDLPLESGLSNDFTVQCTATAIEVSLVDAAGQPVADTQVAIGWDEPVTAPVRVFKTDGSDEGGYEGTLPNS